MLMLRIRGYIKLKLMKRRNEKTLNRITELERLYDYLKEYPKATYVEISDALGISYGAARNYVHRLKDKGLIKVGYEGTARVYSITKEYPVSKARKPKTYKQEVYVELVEGYREDFRECASFEERLKVGREIRIILADM